MMEKFKESFQLANAYIVGPISWPICIAKKLKSKNLIEITKQCNYIINMS